MNDSHPVFFDPRGSRRRFAKAIAWILGLVSVAATIFFATTLFEVSIGASPTKPRLPKPLGRSLESTLRHRQLQAARADLARSIMTSEKARIRSSRKPADRLAVAFYAPWEASGLASLRANASKLSDLIPAWLHLSHDGSRLDLRDFDLASNPSNRDAISIARENGLAVIPMLDNSENDHFDSGRLASLLSSDGSQDRLIESLKSWLLTNGFQGINVDFEEVPDGDGNRYQAFLQKLRAAFSPAGLAVTMDYQVGQDELDLKELSDDLDWMVLMAYDNHSESSGPGPIAPIPWSQKQLDGVLAKFPESKLVLGVGAYGYDWTKGGSAHSVSFSEAMSLANDNVDDPPKDVIEFDPESLNAHFEFEDDDRHSHEVWMLDAASAYDQWMPAREAGIRGMALWVLGVEDPSVWKFFDRAKLGGKADPSSLRSIEFPYEVQFDGKGEILDVAEQPKSGSRTIQVEPETAVIEDESYTEYAFPYMLRKRGYKPRELVLTFDDGPDANYTPAVLDALRDLHCPATFFVIGQNAEHNPDLARRIVDEGHEIGSHTYTHPNIGAVSPARAELELKATQRAIQCLTDHSTRLFRPPYNADSMPETLEQVVPVVTASKMNYITVGENVDPHDWDTIVHSKDGSTRPKTGEDIAKSVIEDLKSREGTDNEGNIVLLHDAGGDRHATVEALRIMVPQLREMGYRFVRVGDLLGQSEAQMMPPVPPRERAVVGLDRALFTLAYGFDSLLAAAFVLAIFIGLLRAGIIAALALSNRKVGPSIDAISTGSVSVVIAAYNEEKVVVKTVRSVLEADTPLREVIVVDDGSTDGTLSVLRQGFGEDPRVVVLSKENGGKASALNYAIEKATGELLFAIDADTVVEPAAIRLLAAHFGDPKVAAVAGNVEVGNIDNLLTLWQSIEYTTSQNLDRKAYARLNAITVVPGAIGMWRRSAVAEVGGYSSDTQAEDMDLTWKLRRAGFKLETEPRAKAFTEAPESFRSFFRQRSRWAFGTLQCLWKHRGALGRYGWFGRFALPALWLFQVVFQALAPLIDLQVLVSAVGCGLVFLSTSSSSVEVETRKLAMDDFQRVLFMYALFFIVEFVASAIAYRMEKRPIRSLWWLFLQRFVYRQIMYGVIYQSIARALTGHRPGWGKLTRTGKVGRPAS